MNHSKQSSALETLFDPLFLHICACLTLDDKCTTLLLLNKHPRFNPRLCMQCDSITLTDDSSGDNTIARSINRLKFASFVHLIELTGRFQPIPLVNNDKERVSDFADTFQFIDFNSLLHECCIGEALISLKLHGRAYFTWLPFFLDSFKQPIGLKQLTLDGFSLNGNHLECWRGLSCFRSLQQLTIERITGNMDGISRFLPSSLTLLNITFPNDSIRTEFQEAWRSDFFLPQVKFVTTQSESIAAISSTIMRQTQAPRPIASLSISDDLYGPNPTPGKAFAVVRFDLISSLQMRNIPVEFVSEFDTLPVFPALESAELSFASGPNGRAGRMTVVDIGSVFRFLSKSAVRDVCLGFQCLSKPLADDAVRALGSLRSVTRLQVSVGGRDRVRAFASCGADIEATLQAVCWPELTSLSLSFGQLSIEQSCVLLSTCSKLETLKLDQLDSIDGSLLALLAQRCPHISSIDIWGPTGDVLKFTDLVTWFQRYSFPMFSCLRSLRLALVAVDDDALHWLLPRLGPHIEQLTINKNESNLHRLRFFVYLFHELHNLKSIVVDPTQEEADPPPDSMFVYNLSQRMLPDASRHEFVDSNGKRFRRDLNSNGLTGRERFFAALYGTLNRKEKQRFAAWGAGNYSCIPDESEIYSESDDPELWTSSSSDEDDQSH